MSDTLLYLSGGLGVVISIAHGYLGQTKVVRPVVASTAAAKRVLGAIMFLSAVYWFAASVLLLATPNYVPEAARTVIVYGAAAVFLSGCLGNLWATRGRHFGWMLLVLATVLAIAGA